MIENFRPGVMAKYGLEYDALKQLKPDLVMVSISGFGQDGPESGRAAYAAILHGEAGAIDVSHGVQRRHTMSASAQQMC